MKKDTPKRKILVALKKFGFEVAREGAHIILRNDGGTSISIPNHKTLKGSTMSRTVREAGINPNEFWKAV